MADNASTPARRRITPTKVLTPKEVVVAETVRRKNAAATEGVPGLGTGEDHYREWLDGEYTKKWADKTPEELAAIDAEYDELETGSSRKKRVIRDEEEDAEPFRKIYKTGDPEDVAPPPSAFPIYSSTDSTFRSEVPVVWPYVDPSAASKHFNQEKSQPQPLRHHAATKKHRSSNAMDLVKASGNISELDAGSSSTTTTAIISAPSVSSPDVLSPTGTHEALPTPPTARLNTEAQMLALQTRMGTQDSTSTRTAHTTPASAHVAEQAITSAAVAAVRGAINQDSGVDSYAGSSLDMNKSAAAGNLVMTGGRDLAPLVTPAVSADAGLANSTLYDDDITEAPPATIVRRTALAPSQAYRQSTAIRRNMTGVAMHATTTDRFLTKGSEIIDQISEKNPALGFGIMCVFVFVALMFLLRK